MVETMLSGELYFPADPELVAMRSRAEDLTWHLDSLKPSDPERAKLLSELLGAIGPRSEIRSGFRCDYGTFISIGHTFYAGPGCVILDCARVTIGDRVMFAPGVHLYAATHPIDSEQRSSGWELAKPITIGDDVWLGGGVIVCPGVTIGSKTVVGAGSVVTRDLPPGVVAVGNPCRVMRVIS